MSKHKVNVEALSDGKVFKSYRDLARAVGWKPVSGINNTYHAQMKQLSAVCEWRKDVDENGKKLSNKIIIVKVFDKQKLVVDKRKINKKTELTRLISRRVLEIIQEQSSTTSDEFMGESSIYVTLGYLYARIGLVNDYYLQGRNNQSELSTLLDCPIEHVNDFYNCVHANLKKTLYKSLEDLHQQRLVYYVDTKRLVFRSNSSDHFKIDAISETKNIDAHFVSKSSYATESQRKFIFFCERAILEQNELRNFGELYARDLSFRKKFFDEVVAKIRDLAPHSNLWEVRLLSDLDFYYNALELSFYDSSINKEVRRLGEMTDEEREFLRNCVNRDVIEEYLSLGGKDAQYDINQEHLNRLTQNAKQRHQKAVRQANDRDSRYQRLSTDYSTNMGRIAEKVIEQKKVTP